MRYDVRNNQIQHIFINNSLAIAYAMCMLCVKFQNFNKIEM